MKRLSRTHPGAATTALPHAPGRPRLARDFGWGVPPVIASVFVTPRLLRRFGTPPMMATALGPFALDLSAIATFAENKAVLIVGVVLAGAFLGVNNTLITESVMVSAPVERTTASAADSGHAACAVAEQIGISDGPGQSVGRLLLASSPGEVGGQHFVLLEPQDSGRDVGLTELMAVPSPALRRRPRVE